MYVPSYFEFVNSAKLLCGEYALEGIASELRLLNSSRPMILSDATLEKIGSLRILIEALGKSGLKPSAVYTDIPLDSSIEKVNCKRVEDAHKPGWKGYIELCRLGDVEQRSECSICGYSDN